MDDEEKPAIAPPVFVFQKDKAQKRSLDGSSAEDGEDSDKEDYSPPVKRERTSSLTHFPPSNSVSKNNVFMPSTFCQSPTGNSDSEPEEKAVGFRLKPPTLIHGQAPSAGVPSQKPKEQQRSVLRPAMLQAPPTKVFNQSNSKSSSNGVNQESEGKEDSAEARASEKAEDASGEAGDTAVGKRPSTGAGAAAAAEAPFVFGQNLRDRAKVEENSDSSKSKDTASLSTESEETNYFLQYINTTGPSQPASNADSSAKFVFGQNMSDRVLSPPKCSEASVETSKESSSSAPLSEPTSSSHDSSPEKDGSSAAAESLEQSAAAYTKATAKRCLLEKVEVRTGEEAESNVLQVQGKLFVFDKTTQSWIERGRGLLRLNDMASTDDGTLQSRLVMRTQGSLRLILNTKLWPQMQVDKASEKSIRITAMDTEDQGVKVFLISASSKDTGQLFAALHHRILALRSRAEQEPESKLPPVLLLPELARAPEEDSDEENQNQNQNQQHGSSTTSAGTSSPSQTTAAAASTTAPSPTPAPSSGNAVETCRGVNNNPHVLMHRSYGRRSNRVAGHSQVSKIPVIESLSPAQCPSSMT
ncbi:ran-binding protein 3a isoform X2 [Engraulis encrasicolus]|uniref:ran-binding protein 3a isoform X2 n=1 Tax=Engraulis encrasicolus TaxID=184585 RepID=UPI002FD3C9F1